MIHRKPRRKQPSPRPAPAALDEAIDTPVTRLSARYRLAIAGVALLLFASVAVAIAWLAYRSHDVAPLSASAPARSGEPAPVAYVPDERCRECHEAAGQAWRGSHHAKSMMHASEDSVRGDFASRTLRHRGETARFFRRDGKFFVNTQGPDGKPADFEVRYTFGVSPLQQYLVAFPGGRLQALPFAWDTERKRWFFVNPEGGAAAGDTLHWTGRYQNWNMMCAECHSTNLRKGYDAEADTYDTRWEAINVGCQSCHGPGADHVAWAEAANAPRPAASVTGGDAGKGLRASFRNVDARTEVDACGACHSRRQRLTDGASPGEPFLDNYRPELLREGLYHADGQQLDEVFVYGSMLQSRMHQRGVRCTDCHEAHSLKLRAAGNAVCVQCHNPTGNARFPTLKQAGYDDAGHHFHPPGAGAQCISCHMPAKNYMVVHARPDHSFRVPRPDQSVTLGTPNACNQCHADRSARWAADAVARWYGPERRWGAGFADAFAAARAGRQGATPALMRIVRDTTEPPIIRATAASLLDASRDDARAALLEARDDREPLLRAAAVESLAALPAERRAFLLGGMLRDPVRLVRIEAAQALAGVPRNTIPAPDRTAFDAAYAEHATAQAAMADMPATQLNLANESAQRGELAKAELRYRRALQMDPDLSPARTAYAGLLSESGRTADAESLLRAGLRRNPRDATLHHSLGLLLAESGRMSDAAKALGEAARLQPGNARLAYNHGLALQETGRLREAEAMLRQAHTLDAESGDITLALAAILVRKGSPAAAQPLVEQLLARDPGNAQARQLAAHIASDILNAGR